MADIIVVLEVKPTAEGRQRYLDLAAALKPLLAGYEGFIRAERFASLAEEGKLLSMNVWTDEAAVERWRNDVQHRLSQRLPIPDRVAPVRIRIGGVDAVSGAEDDAPRPLLLMEVHLDHLRIGVPGQTAPGKQTPRGILQQLQQLVLIHLGGDLLPPAVQRGEGVLRVLIQHRGGKGPHGRRRSDEQHRRDQYDNTSAHTAAPFLSIISNVLPLCQAGKNRSGNRFAQTFSAACRPGRQTFVKM